MWQVMAAESEPQRYKRKRERRVRLRAKLGRERKKSTSSEFPSDAWNGRGLYPELACSPLSEREPEYRTMMENDSDTGNLTVFTAPFGRSKMGRYGWCYPPQTSA